MKKSILSILSILAICCSNIVSAKDPSAIMDVAKSATHIVRTADLYGSLAAGKNYDVTLMSPADSSIIGSALLTHKSESMSIWFGLTIPSDHLKFMTATDGYTAIVTINDDGKAIHVSVWCDGKEVTSFDKPQIGLAMSSKTADAGMLNPVKKG